jgi:hypothetical protein
VFGNSESLEVSHSRNNMICLSAGASLGVTYQRATHNHLPIHLIRPFPVGAKPSAREIDRSRAKSVHWAPLFGRLAQR